MKRISTRLLLFFLFSFLFAGALSASAEQYKSMIRYDRVWEYIYIHWNDTRTYYVKLDGTEEINGKTYHRLVAFKEVRYTYDYDAQVYILDTNDDYLNYEGYLREEDGKVYTLVATGINEWGNRFMKLYVPGQAISDSYILEEKLLYDFTIKEKESFQGVCALGWAEEVPFIADSIEHVEIDGEDHRLFRIHMNDECYRDFTEPMVEGIGFANYGCLTSINLDVPTCPCMNHIFNRVLSTDGRVVYRNEDDCVEVPVGSLAGISSISSRPREVAAPLYDILGRRISTPAPGQLYIQDGKKHIAK